MNIQKIGVVGAGIMGTGIAQVAAVSGYGVAVWDISPQARDAARVTIDNNLRKMTEAGVLTEQERRAALALSNSATADSTSRLFCPKTSSGQASENAPDIPPLVEESSSDPN